jgi:hypothetical protein
MDAKKKNIIYFACKMIKTELPVCMVMEPWTQQYWFSAPDYDRRVKRVNIMCWMYSAYTASEM